MTPKTAVLLLNVGTPDKPEVSAVRKYLLQFLNDPRVITLPWLARKILVNFIIVPFRVRRSTERYRKLWTGKGSPLLVHGRSLQQKLQALLGKDFQVELAMNYGQPGLAEVLKKAKDQKAERIIAFPLFPQYATSTTGSVLEKIMRLSGANFKIPALTTITQYYDHPLFLEAWTSKIEEHNYREFDYILFSYHGLPLSQVLASHPGKTCDECRCTTEVNVENRYCYHAACYATTRLLAARLQMESSRYTVCFQSRISKNWLGPFTDKTIVELAKLGKKRILVVCPSFTADCLETTVEVGMEFQELFRQHGGESLVPVESLNDSDAWVKAIGEMIRRS